MTIQAQLADGRILEFPDGTDPTVIQETVKRQIAQQQGGATDAFFEPLGAITANFAGLVGSGLAGITELIRTGDLDSAVNAIESIQQDVATRFAPETEAGKAGLQTVADIAKTVEQKVIRPIGGAATSFAELSRLATPTGIAALALDPAAQEQALQRTQQIRQDVQQQGLGKVAGERTFERTGSPALAAFATALPEVAEELIPGGAAVTGARRTRAAAEQGVVRAREAISVLEDAKAGKVTDQGLQQVAETITKGTPQEIAEVVKADPEFFRAADELGITTEPIAAFASQNPQFRDVSGALQKVPGSIIDVQARDFITETATKADELIQQYGGTLDKAQLGLDFKADALKTIDDLATQADDVYGTLRQLLPEGNRFEAPNAVSFLQDLATKEKIPPRFARILSNLQPKKGKSTVSLATGARTTENIFPTLGKIDQLRREVGQALNKNSGPFKDVETGLNKALYARLTRDQDAIASGAGLVDVTDGAKALVVRRKQLEDNLQLLLGKDLNQALNVNVAGAVKNLQKGEIDKFNQVINAIPKQKRGEVVLSAMNDVFKGTGVGQQQLSPTQFVKWFQTINRSPAAKKALFGALPPGSKKAIDNLFEVSRGVSRALGQTTPTGRINAMFNPETGFIRKMVGKAIPSAVSIATGSPAAAFATNAVSDFLRQGSDGARAASDLMGTAQFQNLIRQSVKEGVIDGAQASQKLLQAEAKLMKSKRYKQWVDSLGSDDKAALAGGFLGYAFGQGQEQQQ
jgi:hypothetical protein